MYEDVAYNRGVKLRIKLSVVRNILLGVFIFALGVGGGYLLAVRQGRVQAEQTATLKLADVVGRTDKMRGEVDFSQFWEVWDRLEKEYLDQDKVDAQEMVYGAIRGMTSALGDPYTAYLPPEDNQQSREDLAGEFAGVGIQLGYVDSTLAVMAPLPDHPAIRAGVKAGDLILHIKDETTGVDVDTDGMNLSEAVQAIRGVKGVPVTLTIYTQDQGAPREVTLVRDTIVVPSVELTWLGEDGKENENGQVAHLQVIRFGERTEVEWEEAVTEIVRRSPSGIVLDVRNNPGGYLQGAIDLSSEFIQSGVVVQQQGRERTETFSARGRARLNGYKVVALVNRGSASASEILVGALRDQLGIQLVGEKTFGKGTVQEAQQLSNGAGLHVTIARWLLPNGENIHGDGLEVNVEVADDLETQDIDEQVVKAVEVLRG